MSASIVINSKKGYVEIWLGVRASYDLRPKTVGQALNMIHEVTGKKVPKGKYKHPTRFL